PCFDYQLSGFKGNSVSCMTYLVAGVDNFIAEKYFELGEMSCPRVWKYAVYRGQVAGSPVNEEQRCSGFFFNISGNYTRSIPADHLALSAHYSAVNRIVGYDSNRFTFLI